MSTPHWTCEQCGERNVPETPRCLRCKGYKPAPELRHREVSPLERHLDLVKRRLQELWPGG